MDHKLQLELIEYIRESYKYDENLPSKFYNVKTGKAVGYFVKRGNYYQFNVKGHILKGARFSWMYHYGHVPDDRFVKHKDADTKNHSKGNLYIAKQARLGLEKPPAIIHMLDYDLWKRNSYLVVYKDMGKPVSKMFKTKEEAVEYRDDLMKNVVRKNQW